MLYERWREIAHQFKNEIALRDWSSGQSWTFGQLCTATENGIDSDSSVIYPQGGNHRFVFTLLQAWSSRRMVCPLESGQAPPSFAQLPGNCVHLKTTSATTGSPRVIAFKEEQLVADAENIVATMGLRADWPNLGVISLAHSYGFSNLVLPLLLHGIPLVLLPAPLPEIVRKAADERDAVTLPAVPALWRVWHNANAISGKVRLAISAGAPLPLSLEEAIFKKLNIKIHNFYGSSECGGIAYDNSNEPRQDGSFAGAPLKNVKVSLNAQGCLGIQSTAVGETYWPESKENLSKGRFETSDLAEIRNGMIYLRGRASDQINVAGRKLSPEAIEFVLLRHTEVNDCLVFGVPSTDAERTEDIVACVVSKSGLQTDALKAFLLSHVPAWQVPKEWWMVDSLETSQRGKPSRAEWRKKYLLHRR